MSTTARPVKVITIACPDPEGFRVSKTGRVTVVVVMMMIFSKHKKISTALNFKNQSKALKSLKLKKIVPD